MNSLTLARTLISNPASGDPPLLDDCLRATIANFEDSDDAILTHKIVNLEGSYAALPAYYPSVMLAAYTLELAMTLVMIFHFHAMGQIGYNYWVTSAAMLAWQHYANIVLFYAAFGSKSRWTESSMMDSKPLYEFIFYEGWCGMDSNLSRLVSITLGLLLGPLCPIVFFIHWSRWEASQGRGCIAPLKRAVGKLVNGIPLLDKREHWLNSDLEFRRGASQPQLFRYLVQPSVFLILFNVPFALFQFFIYVGAVLNMDVQLIDSVHIVAIFVAYFNILLTLVYITPTPFWEWFFLSFFSCSFDLLIIVITGLIHPHYRSMNFLMGNFSWIWTWTSMLTSLWIPYWWLTAIKRRLVMAAHVGSRYANLQQYFTQLMGLFFTCVYTALGQYRTFSWIIEFEFATNRARFQPAGAIAKIVGWIRLPLHDPLASRNHISPVSDYDLRVLIANLIIGSYLEDQTVHDSRITAMLTVEQTDCLEDLAHRVPLEYDSIIDIRRFMMSRFPTLLLENKMNICSIAERRARETTTTSDTDDDDVSRSYWTDKLQCVLVTFMLAYGISRMIGLGFIGFTIGSFVYALVQSDMASNLNNRDLIALIFLGIQVINFCGIVYYGVRSWAVRDTARLIMPHLKTVSLRDNSAQDVIEDIMHTYDDAVADISVTYLLQDYFSEDLARLIRSFLPFIVSEAQFQR